MTETARDTLRHNLDALHARRHDPQRTDPVSPSTLREKFHGVADVHAVMRRVMRIADDHAKRAGLDPLEHKVLIQVFGAREQVTVSYLANRLDISEPLASRLIKSLVDKGLVVRTPSEADRRRTNLSASDRSVKLIAEIDREVSRQVDYFQAELREVERISALRIFGLYLGVDADTD